MSVDREDFEALLARREAEHAKRMETRERVMARQARVQADKLTGDPVWDKFLSYLQPLLEDAQKVQADMGRQVFRTDLTTDGVMVTRLTQAHAEGRAAAFAEAMDLPKRLVGEAMSEGNGKQAVPPVIL